MSRQGGQILDGRARLGKPVRRGTFALLDELRTLLGTTDSTFWPFLESVGTLVNEHQVHNKDILSRDQLAARNLQDEFSPYQHEGGVFSYYLDATGNQYLRAPSSSPFSFDDGGQNDPMSMGMWIFPLDITAVTLISKYTATVREYRWYLDGSSKPTLELYDESEDATQIGSADTAVTLGTWTCLAVTYDGEAEEGPEVLHYRNGVVDGNGATTESGSYVGMEDTASKMVIGMDGALTSPSNLFNGRVALPWITKKELSGNEVGQIYQIGRELLGV